MDSSGPSVIRILCILTLPCDVAFISLVNVNLLLQGYIPYIIIIIINIYIYKKEKESGVERYRLCRKGVTPVKPTSSCFGVVAPSTRHIP